MKKIVAAVAALMVAGAAFADVSFSYKGTGIVGGKPKTLGTDTPDPNKTDDDTITGDIYRKDCLALKVATDVAGVVFDMDIVPNESAEKSTFSLDEFYGWMTFGLPVGNLQITSGKWTARNVNRVKADAGELDGTYFEVDKPGVLNGTIANDSANLTKGKMSTVLAYTLTDVLPGSLMLKFGLVGQSVVTDNDDKKNPGRPDREVDGEYGKFDSQAGFVGEVAYDQAGAVKATVAVKSLKADKLSLGVFVSPQFLDALSATVGFSFGKDKDNSEWGIDARARYAITEKVAVDGMFNYSKTALTKGANDKDLASMWYLAGVNLKATEDVRVVAAFNSTIADFSAERGGVESHFVPAMEFTPSEKAKVTVGFDAKWTGALYSGVADISLPVYVNFSL